MDCEITVPGADAGVRGNGAPAKTKVGPVSSFLKDSDHYYRAVWKHVKTCPRCDPAEILRGFLANREKKHFGQTSSLLVAMAERYRRSLQDRVPEPLVREFVVRSMSSWPTFEERVATLSAKEILRAEELYMESWRGRVVKIGVREDFRLYHAFYEAQGYVGWLNARERRATETVPRRTERAAAMSRSAAMRACGWDLAIWLITRHTWETAVRDPVAGSVMANVLAAHVLRT